MAERLIACWVYGGALAGLLLLLLSPLLLASWPAAVAATFLLLPAYMLHQYEEHDGDRFRLFFNATVGQGSDLLSPLAVFLINVPGVWGVMVLALYGAVFFDLGWALIAVYLVLVNAMVHIAHGVAFRSYNPGLWTAGVVFLPLGLTTLYLLHEAGARALSSHAGSLVFAVASHAAILLLLRRKLTLLRRRDTENRA